MLAAAASEVGGVQIQNRGTLGGNVANASPAGDTLPVLAAAEAIVVLRSAAGTRRVPFTAFYTGYRQSVRRQDELIVGFEIPADPRPAVVPEGRHPRRAGDFQDRDRRRGPFDPRRAGGRRREIALGSVAPTVIRATRTERRSPAARRSTTRSVCWSRRSRRSTTSDPRPSIAGASRPTCWRGFGPTAHRG